MSCGSCYESARRSATRVIPSSARSGASSRDFHDGEERLSFDADPDLTLPQGYWSHLRDKYGLQAAMTTDAAAPIASSKEGLPS